MYTQQSHFTNLLIVLATLIFYPQFSICQALQLPNYSEQFSFGDTCNLTLDIFNPTNRDTTIFLQLTNAETYKITTGDGVQIGGVFSPSKKFYTAFDKRFSKINLNARDTSFLRVEAYNVSKSDFTVSLTFLSKAEALELNQNALHKAINGVILSLVLLGTMIGMFLYFFFNFIQTKRRELLLYSIYIFFIILNYIIRLDGFLQVYLLFEENPIRYFQLGEPIQSVMYISYLYFICDFLNVKKHNIRLYRFMVFQILMFVVIGIIFSYFSFVERDIMFVQDELGVLWYIHFILCIIMIIWIWVVIPERAKHYILIGTIILALASITDLIYSLTPEGNFHFSWHTPPTYYGIYSFNILQLGIIAELTLFSLAIGQKTNEVYLDRDRSHKSLIFQLKENQKLQNKFTQELQSEIEKKSSQIILEKEKTIKTQFENQILQLESEMLQTQMNPHFIFNSLNSIKYFAMTKSKSETSAYISDFSKLMRMILQNSRRKLTSLREELEFLQLYLEIESKRYQGKFDYEFIVDKKINAQSLFIPPMLIQPIIENSMVHGLLPKTEKGMVSINFMVNEQVLKIVIEDNGIGRKASALLQRERKINTKSSLATKITNERIKVINELYQIKAEMTILDLNSEDGSSLGTRVIVDLPAILESNFD